MKISENRIIQELNMLIEDADCDMLACFAADLFGGECEYVNDGVYEFIPNENYQGAFGDENSD